MKAVLPLAGKGTRLRPHTLHTPKALVKVAGKPVLSFIIDDLIAFGVDEMVFIVGHLRDTMEAWIRERYPAIRGHYVVQEVQNGTAGAVALAAPYVDEEVLIVFPDALIDVDYRLIRELDPEYGGVIWAMEVEDYQRYGVIVTDDAGNMVRIIEKPSEPVSKLANIGLYYMRDHASLFEGIRHTMSSDPGKGGEFYLTDAFQYMVDQGSRILTASVEAWWDAGKPETLLDTNARLLRKGRSGVDPAAEVAGAQIVEPVRIEAGVVVKGGRIGPNVTLEAGSTAIDCDIEHTIVGPEAKLERSQLRRSIIGAHARIRHAQGSLLVTDHSVVDGDA